MQITENIVKIQDLFDAWREAGHTKLPNGVELIGRTGEDGDASWLHAVFPGLDPRSLDALEKEAGAALPPQLRAFYRLIGGMSLFHGAFCLYGKRRRGIRTGAAAVQAGDIVELNHEIDVLGWRPAGAIAFAVNGWDQSVHVAGMGRDAREITRCDRATGRVLEVHATIYDCVYDRLYRLDQLMLA